MLKRTLSLLLSLAVGATLMVGPATPAAEAALPTPKDGVIFNNIITSSAAARRLVTQLDLAISGAPRGSVITMAMYLFDMESTTAKLIAAHRRGVHVQMLVDDGVNSPELRRLRAEFTRNKKPGVNSFVAQCKRSCMSNVPGSVIHAKYYLFSQSGRKKNVSLISSGNPHYVNTFNSWNNTHTITDTRIYNFLRRYFLDMRLDRNNHNYYRELSSGYHKVYLFPRAVRSPADVLILDVLNNVSCRNVRRGYGSGGRTVIRIGMWGWTAARLDIARRVWALHNAGCKVEVILNSGRTGNRVFATLLKRSSRYGKMKIYDAWYDKNNNNVAGRYMHHKLVMINGRWFGSAGTKVVYTGSQNFTSTGTLVNNDMVLRVKHNSVYAAYNSNMNYIRERKTRRVYSTPRVSSGARQVNPDSSTQQVDPELLVERSLDR